MPEAGAAARKPAIAPHSRRACAQEGDSQPTGVARFSDLRLCGPLPAGCRLSFALRVCRVIRWRGDGTEMAWRWRGDGTSSAANLGTTLWVHAWGCLRCLECPATWGCDGLPLAPFMSHTRAGDPGVAPITTEVLEPALTLVELLEMKVAFNSTSVAPAVATI